MFRRKKQRLVVEQKIISPARSMELPVSASRKQDSPLRRAKKENFSLSSINSVINLSQKLNSPKNPRSLGKLAKKPNTFTNLSKQFTKVKHNARVLLNKDLPFSIKSKFLEQKMTEVTEIYEKSGLTQRTFGLYEQIFSEIIENSKEYGPVLSEIKERYNEWAASHGMSKETLKIKKENLLLKQKLKEKSEENDRISKKFQSLCNENIKLGKQIDKFINDLEILNNRLVQISKISLDNVATDENSWKALVLGNKEYSEICKSLKLRVKELEHKHDTYLKMLYRMKNFGVDVDKFLKPSNVDYNDWIWEDVHNSLEFEYLPVDKNPNVKKPNSIPLLRIEGRVLVSSCSNSSQY